jgi:amino acid permease
MHFFLLIGNQSSCLPGLSLDFKLKTDSYGSFECVKLCGLHELCQILKYLKTCDRWMVTFKLLWTEYLSFPVTILTYINITIYYYQEKSSVPKSNCSSWNTRKKCFWGNRSAPRILNFEGGGGGADRQAIYNLCSVLKNLF